MPVRIVVAGFGNTLRSDDGFGPAVVERLTGAEVPRGVELMDTGIGGIHLVQALMDPADALVIIDAVEVERAPGTVVVVRPDVEDARELGPAARREELADMHFATPDRALMLARSMDVLPAETLLVGCQPVDASTPGRELSPEVSQAVAPAADEVRRVITELGIPWERAA